MPKQIKDKEPCKLQKRLIISGKPEVDTYVTVNWTEKSLIFNIRCKEPSDSIVLLLESPYHSLTIGLRAGVGLPELLAIVVERKHAGLAEERVYPAGVDCHRVGFNPPDSNEYV